MRCAKGRRRIEKRIAIGWLPNHKFSSDGPCCADTIVDDNRLVEVLLTVCVSNLMTTLLDPPAANGTTTCTGRSGNDVAISGAAVGMKTATDMKPQGGHPKPPSTSVAPSCATSSPYPRKFSCYSLSALASKHLITGVVRPQPIIPTG